MDDRKDLGRFENHVGSHVVFANYDLQDKTLIIKYVEAPPELRGSGEAGKLMQDIINHARARDLKIIPICGYAVSWINRHPDTHDVLAE